MKRIVLSALLLSFAAMSCQKQGVENVEPAPVGPSLSLEDVATLLSSIPLGGEQMQEVYTAVSSSCGNGYDEEYTLGCLFSAPGSGVGDESLPTKADNPQYDHPMKDLIREQLAKRYATKSGIDDYTLADQYISELASSGMQIYWPFSDAWDGSSTPIITFDPGGAAESNIGYRLNSEGEVEEIVVTETMAKEHPVWVVNNNEDSSFRTIELMRKQGVDLSNNGSIVLGAPGTKAVTTDSKAFYLKDFTAKRDYDTWFCGGSEFVIRCGGINNFKASTEAELKLYYPLVTDFLVEVKRSQIGKTLPLNCIMLSEVTPQIETIAFMIVEDDGGTIQSWNCEAMVKINSKSYGVTLSLPLNSRDDIVWRGSLTYNFVAKYSGKVSNFGDVAVTCCLE